VVDGRRPRPPQPYRQEHGCWIGIVSAMAAFDADTRDFIEKFDYYAQIGRLDRI
jgi:hypothetical protein